MAATPHPACEACVGAPAYLYGGVGLSGRSAWRSYRGASASVIAPPAETAMSITLHDSPLSKTSSLDLGFQREDSARDENNRR